MNWRGPFQKKGKYGSTKAEVAGKWFQSKLEAARYAELLILERAGEIANLKTQVQVHLTRAKILYKPDFSYVIPTTNEMVFEETKGFETAVWAIKKRLWRYYGPGKLIIWKGHYSRLVLDEEIIPTKKGHDDE